MKKLIFLLLMIVGVQTQAQVWVAEQSWSSSWQNKYAQWVASNVGPNFFKQLGGEYAKLRVDCADAHYALLAYFSFHNKLEFTVDNGNVTNMTTRFNNYTTSEQRLIALIKFMVSNLGTESLAHRDTYPVAINSLMPGDLFMYKVGTNGNFTRHTYIIKNINPDGTFDVLYSTQDRMKKGLPLNRHASYMFTKAPTNKGVDQNHWGFRRSKMPQHASIPQEQLSLSDFSQYSLARSVDNLGFFREVRRIHQSVQESPNMALKRNFNTVCSAVQDRVEIVTNGVRFVKSVGGRCLSYQEYDTYSTPSRDSGIKDNYRNFEIDFASVLQKGEQSRVDGNLLRVASVIFQKEKVSGQQATPVYQQCPINTGLGGINLAHFKQSLFAGRVSFHPNDTEGLRWGVSNEPRTRCEQFYGYPTN